MIALRVVALSLGVSLTYSAVLAGELPAKPYDRDNNGVLDDREATVWRLHNQDPLLAKYDTNFNGRIDADEAEKLRADSQATFQARASAVADDVSFFRGRKIAEIDKVAANRPPAPESPKPPFSKSPAMDCEQTQRLFIRRDRLDTFQYRDSTFATQTISRSNAKGASVAYTKDIVGNSQALTVNGRVSYLLWQNDPMSPCFTGVPSDPYAPHDFSKPSVFGSLFGAWVDAQGTINYPRSRSERNSLQAGFDAQASIVGGPLFDMQYVVLSPYGQTDFRGEAQAYGLKAGWEPIAANARLGGTLQAPPTPYLDWFWQLRGEVDIKRVENVGSTSLRRANYAWVGGVARLHATLFPDLSAYDAFATPAFPDLVNRIYAALSINYYHDADSGLDVHLWTAEVGYNLTPDGKSSISLQYTQGTDKDSLTRAQQYLVALNYKY